MKPFLLLIPFMAHLVGTVPEAGMLHMAGQSAGFAERYLGEDLHELCSQACPAAVEMSVCFLLHKCTTPAVRP